MTTPSLLCAGAEIALNAYLRREPAALRSCAELAGHRIALAATDLGWALVIELHPGGVRVDTDDRRADVRVRAPGARLLTLAAARSDTGLPAGVDVEGDAELLQRFRELLARVDLDLEEVLAGVLGDALAHRAAQAVRRLWSAGRHATQSLAYSAAEYLREETGDLARAADVEEWMDAVDTLREAVDRLEARLQRLERTRAESPA